MGKIIKLNNKQLEALQRIILDWISDGFTTPPYDTEYYDIFEKIEIEQEDLSTDYDIRRPKEVN